MANWTTESLIGQVFKTLGNNVPTPARETSPSHWGTRVRNGELFGADASAIVTETRQFNFRYRSPEHMLEVFRGYYGPILKAFAALDEDKQHALAEDLIGLMNQINRGGHGGLVVPSDYHEIVITRR